MQSRLLVCMLLTDKVCSKSHQYLGQMQRGLMLGSDFKESYAVYLLRFGGTGAANGCHR